MSRVAKNPIHIPKNVEVSISGQIIQLKGPKGLLSNTIHPSVKVEIEEDEGGTGGKVLKFSTTNNTSEANVNAGTARALTNNMLIGITHGFEQQLELVGVGYRAQAKGKILNLALGFSHPIDFPMPDGITAETPSNTLIVLKGIDKQLLGQVAAEIRRYRPPEPYKGKGIRYSGEAIIRKETKKK